MKTTRAQQSMRQAMELVGQVAEQDKKVQEIYGGLCHDFPILVRMCGLCQAVAFSVDKAQSDDKARAKAHQLLLCHIGAILGIQTDDERGKDDPLLKAIMEADVPKYMLYTRQILHAWVYFKRFAVSLLGVKTGGAKQ